MFSERMGRVSGSAIMELIKTTAAGDYISFASGLPDPSLFPIDELRGAADEVLTEDGRAALQYGPAEGYTPLREYVADLLRRRGLPASVENVLITSGSQQSLDLTARALLDPGDGVVIESPSYLAGIQIFDSYQARYHTIAMDGSGLLTDALWPALAQRPKLVYVLPNFQNPTGISLEAGRRATVAEAVAKAGVAVLEDDAYHDLRYEGEPLPAVCSLAENRWAVYTGTFSKTIAPGLRVAYVSAHPELIRRLAQLKQITDLHAGSFTQRVVHRYCVRGCLEPGIERLRSVYRARRDAMLTALEQHLSGTARWTRPEGGMFIFLTLAEGRNAEELLTRALSQGIVFVPGVSFHADGKGANTLRLNFVSADEESIRRGIAILAAVIRSGGG